MKKLRGFALIITVLAGLGGGGYQLVNHTGEDIQVADDLVIKSIDITEHSFKVYPGRQTDSICFKAVLHHDGLDTRTTIDSLSRLHVKKDWPRLSYHFAVYEGKIYFINPVEKLTWHAKGVNSISIGIVILGNYEVDYLSVKTITTLKTLLQAIEQAYCINEVLGHRDVRATLCPGEHAYQQLKLENIIQ